MMAETNTVASVEQFGYKQELKRALGIKDLVIFGMTFMSPMSCTTMFGIMAGASIGHNFISYLIGFVAVLFTALSYRQMIPEFPIAGSVYTYAGKGIHPSLGFIGGWTITLDYFLIPMFLYLINATYANALIPAIPYWAWVVIYVVPCMVINIRGVEMTAKANLFFWGLMCIAVLAFVVAAARYAILGVEGTSFIMPTAIFNPATFNFQAVLQGSIIAVMSLLGFDGISTLAEESKVPPKKIGKAILIALSIQTILYLLVSYFGTIVAPDVSIFPNIDSVFFEMCFSVGGYGMQLFVTIIIMVTGFGPALAGQSAAARVLYGMGRDNLLPKKFFGYVHPKFKTPMYSILMMGIVGLIGALTIGSDILSNLVSFGGLYGFTFVNLAVILYFFFRKKSGRFFAHFLFPLVGIIVCQAVVFIGMIPFARTVGFIWLGLGVLYLLIRSRKPEFRELLRNVNISE